MLSRLRTFIGRNITRDWIGALVRRVFRRGVPSRGLTIDVSRAPVRDHAVAMIFWGLYEAPEVALIRRWLRRDLDVVELGASLGVVTCHLRRHLQPDRRLVSVEANPRLLDQIAHNVRLNGDASGERFTLVHAAVAYTGAAVRLVLATTADSSLEGMLQPEGETVSVPSITLSALLAQHDIWQPYALVCDIEGAEHALLHEDAAALAGCAQIVIELHTVADTAGASETDAVRALEALGFRLVERRKAAYAFERGSSAPTFPSHDTSSARQTSG